MSTLSDTQYASLVQFISDQVDTCEINSWVDFPGEFKAALKTLADRRIPAPTRLLAMGKLTHLVNSHMGGTYAPTLAVQNLTDGILAEVGTTEQDRRSKSVSH